jgi:membrane-associated phospholipid phosphatase
MQSMEKSIRTYLFAFLLFEVICLTFVCSMDRLTQMQWINGHHSRWADYLFQGLSASAEIITPIAIILYFFWKKKYLVKPFLISYAVSTGIIQFAKHLIFSDALRPHAYFKGIPQAWHWVDGVFMYEFNSMPSGHTSAAWFMCFWLAFVGKSGTSGIIFALLAAGVAYSRVYLFQHFPVDTAVGAFVGTAISFLVYYFYFLKPSKHDQLPAA